MLNTDLTIPCIDYCFLIHFYDSNMAEIKCGSFISILFDVNLATNAPLMLNDICIGVRDREEREKEC